MNDFDLRLNFPIDGLAPALDGLAALRGDETTLPNALGDPRDANGAPVMADAVWIGRPGSAAGSYTDEAMGETVEIPAKGDPSRYYVHIRSERDAPTGFDPSAYGMVPTDPAESAAVLGVWAGDEVTA